VRFLGIYGVNPFENFQSNYRINDIPRVRPQDVTETQKVNNQPAENLATPIMIEEIPQENRQKSVNPNEISIGINKNNDFSYIGRDKDIRNLDMQKAISTMRQDSVLQEYQYFVGSAKNVFHSEDGTVFAK